MRMLIALALMTAHADRKSNLLGASLQMMWAAFTQKYPSVPAADLRTCGERCVMVNGETHRLTKPSTKLAELPDVEVVGVERDSSKPYLLLKTRTEDPTLIWAMYNLYERRLKFLGYDRANEDLPGELDGAAVGAAARTARNIELLKFATTRSASNLNVTREELSMRIGCEPEYRAQLRKDIAELRGQMPAVPTVTGRLAELQAVVALDRIGYAGDELEARAFHCDPKRARFWREYLLQLRALVDYTLDGISGRELALDPSAPRN